MRAGRSLIPLLFPAAMLPIFAANGALVYFALHSRPALVDQRPYEDGRAYNRELAAAAAQARLGWTATLDAPTQAGRLGPVALTVANRTGTPIGGLDVELRIWRPVGSQPDLRLHLAETSPGNYAAATKLPLAGQWQFDVVARRGSAEFVYAQRVVLR